MAVLAFILSLGGVSGAILAFVTLVLFLSSCCCTMNKCGLISAGVLGILTAIILTFFAIAIPMNLHNNEGELRNTYGGDFYDAIMDQVKIRTYLMFGGALLWLVASILMFVFAGSRYDRVVQSYEPVAMAITV